MPPRTDEENGVRTGRNCANVNVAGKRLDHHGDSPITGGERFTRRAPRRKNSGWSGHKVRSTWKQSKKQKLAAGGGGTPIYGCCRSNFIILKSSRNIILPVNETRWDGRKIELFPQGRKGKGHLIRNSKLLKLSVKISFLAFAFMCKGFGIVFSSFLLIQVPILICLSVFHPKSDQIQL